MLKNEDRNANFLMTVGPKSKPKDINYSLFLRELNFIVSQESLEAFLSFSCLQMAFKLYPS